MNSKQKITIDQQSSSSVIGHTDSMVQQPTLFDDQQQQQQQLRPIIVPPSTIPTTTTTTIKSSSSSKKNDIEHFVSHDDRSLRKQQERDDMLLQKEKERMSRDRLNRNKDPVVVSISQKSSSNSATASAMKRIKKTIDRMRSLNQVESEKNRNQYESNDEGDEGDDNNYDSDAASDESDADGEYFDESIMIRRNKPTTTVAAAAEKAGTITEKAEKTSNENKRCKNTVSGHDLVTDSRGFTCYASDLSTRTMCCRHSTLYSNTLDESRVKQVEKQGQDDGEEKDSKQEEQEENKTITTEAKRYSCDTCHSQYQCCESYEYCVSCCLKPQNRPMIEQLHKKYLSQQKLLYTRIRTAFDFCAARCRTNSNSVVNENRYRTHWKHCFGAKDPADIFSSSSSR